MKALVYGYKYKKEDRVYIQKVMDKMHEEKIETFAFKGYYDSIKEDIKPKQNIQIINDQEEFSKSKIDFILTLGGDGTILKAATITRDSGIPILGINLGRLGFLAAIEKTFAEKAIDTLLEKKYRIEERSMVYVESNIPVFGETPFALNDFTLHKRDTSSMMVIHAYVDGDFLNSYWADGLIVSTPTGSTGYSLSCGGPIVFPGSGNFIITPVAPHNLNVRPLVLSDNAVISFELESRYPNENFLCTLDSRFETIDSSYKISVRKCSFGVRLIILEDVTFLKTIHEKLYWGSDSRKILK